MLNTSSKVKSYFWNSLNNFRGIIEISRLKNYLLTLVFLKFITDETKKNEDFQYNLPAELNFDSLIELANNQYLGNEINNKLRGIVELHPTLKDVIDFNDFNDITSVGDIRTNTEALYDLILLINSSNKIFDLNNSYETNIWANLFDSIVLMFAELSGKSFLDLTTPKEVNLVISKLLNIQETKDNISIYDPTCGNGNSFISIAENYKNHFNFFGQEINYELVSVARMNLIIHRIESFEILEGDVLNNPKFLEKDNLLKKFDYVVSNPPFGVKNWNRNNEFDDYNRWNSNTGIPSNNNADLAFVLHVLESLKVGGKAVVIIPHGVLFRGGSELNIRKHLIHKGYLKGIIGLPSKLYFGTGIPSCMMVLEKSEIDKNDGVFLIDASSEFVKDNFTNKLTAYGVNKIIETWSNQIQLPEFSKSISKAEIIENDYNLNIPRYLSNTDDFQIPEDSKLVELNDLLVSVPKIRTENDFGRVVRISDLSDNTFLYQISLDSLTKIDVNKTFYKIVKPTLLLSKRFNKLKPSFCDASVDNPVFISPDIEAFCISNDRIDLSYLILQLNTDYVSKQAESFSVGSTMPSLSRQDILKIKVIVPNLSTQESIIRQKALAEGAKIQSDKGKIEAFQLQNTIDTLLKERMNDFQWKLHDLRNGELLNLKGQIIALEMYADANPQFFNHIIDEESDTTIVSSIKEIYNSVQKLAVILSDLYDTSDNVSVKEDIDILIFLKDFCEQQLGNNGNLFEIDYSDIEKIKIDFDIIDLVVLVNRNDLNRIFTNIFENAVRHSGFGESSQINKIKIELSLDHKKEIISIAILNNGKPSKISELDYFADGGKAGSSSNSGKGGHIIKVLAERNNGKVFQNNYTVEEAGGYTFEVAIQFNYKLFYEL
ncbi:N-6 DNA methylase [Flavobacterium daejeonense]|uniref:N-6 DNA methylase n=1 Tax=Flavobacterium daejeonense TaxID=350893 RepID=UPI00047B84BB|nr:N-6 DNA methylase [Flavobacterium daejeonense]